VSSDGGVPSGGESRQSGIAAAITEVSERASVLIREEIELAKIEITEKTTRLAKGAVVAIVAGVFFLTALFFVLIGCAWLLYYELPIGNAYTYFWGFFAMALILMILGVIAGIVAAKAVRKGAPPTPEMAIEEARKIRETVSSSGVPASGHAGTAGAGAGPSSAAGTAGAGAAPSGAASAGTGAAGSTPPLPPPGAESSATNTGKGGGYGTTLGS
jgi:uncharacterized membrane protein YqjE